MDEAVHQLRQRVLEEAGFARCDKSEELQEGLAVGGVDAPGQEGNEGHDVAVKRLLRFIVQPW